MSTNLLDLKYVEIKRETERAYLVKFDENSDGSEVVAWLPKSQITLHQQDGIVVVPGWLAIDKGIENYVEDDAVKTYPAKKRPVIKQAGEKAFENAKPKPKLDDDDEIPF